MMGKTINWIVLINLAIALPSCTVSMQEFKGSMAWKTIPSSESIDAHVRIEAECFFTPEYTQYWYGMMNNDETIANYKNAECQRIVEDMQNSHIFSRVNMGADYDLAIKIDYTESKSDGKMALSIIEPVTGKVLNGYNAESTFPSLRYSDINNALSYMLTELRTQLFADYKAGKGIKSALAAAGKTRKEVLSQSPSGLPIDKLIPPTSSTKELPKIAVWDLLPRETKPAYAQELTSILVSEITKLKKYEVYSQENVRTLAGWTAERMTLGCTDTKCLTALGQMDIAKLISGSVGKIGDRYSISLNLFDTQKTKAENAVSEFGRSENELIDLVQFAIRKLLEGQ
jgi:hypothetical protein